GGRHPAAGSSRWRSPSDKTKGPVHAGPVVRRVLSRVHDSASPVDEGHAPSGVRPAITDPAPPGEVHLADLKPAVVADRRHIGHVAQPAGATRIRLEDDDRAPLRRVALAPAAPTGFVGPVPSIAPDAPGQVRPHVDCPPCTLPVRKSVPGCFGGLLRRQGRNHGDCQGNRCDKSTHPTGPSSILPAGSAYRWTPRVPGALA